MSDRRKELESKTMDELKELESKHDKISKILNHGRGSNVLWQRIGLTAVLILIVALFFCFFTPTMDISQIDSQNFSSYNSLVSWSTITIILIRSIVLIFLMWAILKIFTPSDE